MSDRDTLVTVAMPVHNAARWLAGAVASALAQTHDRLELLIFDDGSTDGSADLARSFTDPRVRVLSAAANAGVGAARQELKTAARGEYIAWLDADDLYEPTRIAVLLSAARTHDADVVIDASRFMDEQGQALPGVKTVPDHVASDPHFTRLFERNVMNPHPLVSRRCFAGIDFDPELTVSEDYDFWLQASWAGFRFHRVDQALHRYRLTPGSLSSRPEKARQAVKKIFGRFAVEDLKALYRQRGFDEGQVRYMACLQHLFREEYSEALAHAAEPWSAQEEADLDFYRGTLELQCGRTGQAGAYLRRHLTRSPESPAGHNNLGVLLSREGSSGAEAWRRALDLFPGYHDALANMDGQESLTLTQLAPRRYR